jgi:hypothetical protein
MREHADVHSLSKGEAKSVVEEKLRKQQLTMPMTEEEMKALSDVRRWAESWQSILPRSPRD